jgi:hypothetical protein
LLTPPDFNAGSDRTSEALFHARPRGHRLVDLAPEEFVPLEGHPALTAGMRRKVESFVEEHLETPLPIQRLADTPGLSVSHFSRAGVDHRAESGL